MALCPMPDTSVTRLAFPGQIQVKIDDNGQTNSLSVCLLSCLLSCLSCLGVVCRPRISWAVGK